MGELQEIKLEMPHKSCDQYKNHSKRDAWIVGTHTPNEGRSLSKENMQCKNTRKKWSRQITNKMERTDKKNIGKRGIHSMWKNQYIARQNNMLNKR